MRIVALTARKGGAGKTTLAASLAVAAHLEGERVLAVDLDFQATLWHWGQLRKGAGPAVQRAGAADVGRLIDHARQDSTYTLAILDCPGQFGERATLPDADLCLVPVKPSLFDIKAAELTVDQPRLLNGPHAFVLNQCLPDNRAGTLKAAATLSKSGAVAPSLVTSHADFQDAYAAGLGVSELNPTGKAAAEIARLWQWTRATLEGGNAPSTVHHVGQTLH